MTAIPRGLVTFKALQLTPIKPINDDFLLAIGLTLPGGFGYIINEMHLNVIVDTASDFDAVGHWRISDSSPANADFDYRMPFDFVLFSQNGSTNGVRASQIPSGILTRTPIVPLSSGATQTVAVTNRADPAQAGGTVDFVASFWEYDLEQMQFFPAHMALNVVGR